MVVITIGTEKSAEEMIKTWLNRDYWIGGDGVEMANLGLESPSEGADEEESKNIERE